jgi:ABC-type transport system substrate-binding protein
MRLFAFRIRGIIPRARRYAAAAACFVLAVALAGCGNNPYPAGETAEPIIYWAMGDDPKTLDPSVGYDTDTDSILVPIYPGFLQYHYLKRSPFVLEPCLGAAMPEVQTEGTEGRRDGGVKGKTSPAIRQIWTFHIKHGLHFQNDPCFGLTGTGREIMASDFAYTFHRIADPALSCPIISYLDDKIVGMAEYEARLADMERRKLPPDYNYPVPGIQVDPHDPYTFRITLSRVYPQLRFLMAMHFTSPIPHEAVEYYNGRNGRERFADHPVGSGPYELDYWHRHEAVVLKANPNYMPEFYPSEGMPGDREAGLLEDAGKRLPLVKKVRFTILREGVTAWNLFQEGYLDSSAITQNNFQQAMARPGLLTPEMRSKGIRLFFSVRMDVWYYIFNMNDPVVGGYSESHRKLRQAISLATNSQEIIDLMQLGVGIPSQSTLAPGIFGYDPAYRNPWRQFDLAAAKRLLAEAGYPGGIDPKTGAPLTLYYDNMYQDAEGRQYIALFEKQMGALGIKLNVRSWRFPVFQSKIDHNQYQLSDWGWSADYPDPENFTFLLYSKNAVPAGVDYSRYINPEYDRVFEQMRVLTDTPERYALIQKLIRIAAPDCPLVYREDAATYSLAQPWVHNIKPNPVALDVVKYRRVDGTQRARLQAEWNRPNYWPAVATLLILVAGSIPAGNVVRKRTNRHVRRDGGVKG